jgi:putative serine protease PepD
MSMRLLTALPVVLSLAVVAGCGGDDPSTSTGSANGAGAQALEQQYNDVIARVSPQVVQIQTDQGLGSGIVYDDEGHIVTNAHVTGNAERFLVTLRGGDRRRATLVGADPGNDLAVIHMVGGSPTPATFADSAAVEAGDIVFAIGNPLGLQSSVTQGIVSSINRTVGEGSGATLSSALQTSAEINPGNSGGALVSLSGKVVGIPTLAALDPEFGETPAPGIGFAIPSNTVREVADRLLGDGT